MRAVVTGGAGFIGSHLIEALVARGDEVVCVERPGAPAAWVAGLPIAYRDAGLDDIERLADLCRGADVVYHLAGLTEARRPADFYRVNTDGTSSVVRAAAAHNGRAPRVILLSSIAATGPNRDGELLGPDTVPHPISHYGRSKLLAEAVLHAYADRVPGTVVRLPSVYGPRERAVLKLFRLVRRGVALTVGGWDRQASVIYVKDVVQGLLAAASADRAGGRTYCLSHPAPITWREFARAVGRALDREPRLVSVPAPVARVVAVVTETAARLGNRVSILNRERVRDIAQPRWVCDPSRAITEIGFRPEYPLTRGVHETAAWYREARWL
jgi:nucleoside-diphosphate-sugar epimerase